MLSYKRGSKMYKCKMKDGEEILLREEHIEGFTDLIIEKQLVGNIGEIEMPVYDNLFYTD